MSTFVKEHVQGRIKGNVLCLFLQQVDYHNESHRLILEQQRLGVLFNEIKKMCANQHRQSTPHITHVYSTPQCPSHRPTATHTHTHTHTRTHTDYRSTYKADVTPGTSF